MGPASRSWIVLGQDGGHVTVGRAASTNKEIATASAALAEQYFGGWIAKMDGSYWGRGSVTLVPLQIIGTAVALCWPAALTAFPCAR
jgi:hypothetical protein